MKDSSVDSSVDQKEATMEQEGILDSLVKELQQSTFHIPFDAWFFICKKLRAEMNARYPADPTKPNEYKELTDVEARQAYARYVCHVSTNYRQLCKSIITGYPNFVFPEEVKQMLLTAKYNDLEKEHEQPQSQLSSSPVKKRTRVVTFQDDVCGSRTEILDKTVTQESTVENNCSEIQSMISSTTTDIEDDSNKIDKPDDESKLQFINPEPPPKIVRKREILLKIKQDIQCSYFSSDKSPDHEATTPPLDSSLSSSNETSHLDLNESPSPQPTQQFDTINSNNEISQSSMLEECEDNNNTTAQDNNNNGTDEETILRKNEALKLGKREISSNNSTSMKRIRLENKLPWVTPRLVYVPPKLTPAERYIQNFDINKHLSSTAKTSQSSTTPDTFTLIKRDSFRNDPRISGPQVTLKDSEEVIIEDNEREHETQSSNNNNNDVDSCVDDPMNGSSIRTREEKDLETDLTTNNLLENELLRCKDSTIDLNISSVEEEEDSEGEEVHPDKFVESFERRPSCSGSDHDCGESMISSVSDSSSSFYSMSTGHCKDTNQSTTPSQQVTTFGSRSLFLSSDSGQKSLFKITISNDYCSQTQTAVSPPLLSPCASVSSTSSLDRTIPPPCENISNDKDDRFPLNINSEVSSQYQHIIPLSPSISPVPPPCSQASSQTVQRALPLTVPFHLHAINYMTPPAISTLPPLNIQPQLDNPWVAEFEAQIANQSPGMNLNSVQLSNVQQMSRNLDANKSHAASNWTPTFNFPPPQ